MSDDLTGIYHQSLFKLLQQARGVFLQHWKEDEIQLCRLLSIKTGGCSENCGYCSQSAHYKTGVEAGKLMTTEEILPFAKRAKEEGASRFCMGAAWKGVRENDPRFESVLDTIRAVSQCGIEACVTLGELSEEAARRLKEAGLTSYNHNIDTSPDYYSNVVGSHSFDDRLRTIRAVQKAGISLCCGGIIGMGEGVDDRLKMLEILRGFNPPPGSVPINILSPVAGTPMENQPPVDVFDVVRMIATARIALPKTRVRLSAGRSKLSREAQALCFFAGANSIFFGEKLLTADNARESDDMMLLRELGLKPQASS